MERNKRICKDTKMIIESNIDILIDTVIGMYTQSFQFEYGNIQYACIEFEFNKEILN